MRVANRKWRRDCLIVENFYSLISIEFQNTNCSIESKIPCPRDGASVHLALTIDKIKTNLFACEMKEAFASWSSLLVFLGFGFLLGLLLCLLHFFGILLK